MAEEAKQEKDAAKEGESPAAPPAEGEGGAEGATAPAAGGKKKLMMIVSAALLVVGILVAVGVMFVFRGGDGHEESHDGEPTAAPEVAMFDVPEFTINLMGEDATTQHFMKIKLALELANPADSPQVEKLLPRLQDDWGTFMRTLRPADLQGSAALYSLKEGLLRRASQSLAPLEVKGVYIRDLLVQ